MASILIILRNVECITSFTSSKNESCFQLDYIQKYIQCRFITTIKKIIFFINLDNEPINIEFI